MPEDVGTLAQRLRVDEWRVREGFTPDVAATSEQMLKPRASDSDIASSLRTWLRSQQPCIFGRMAAGSDDFISFCVLRDEDLERGDQHVHDKIQRFRLQWKRDAYVGKKSAFLIVVASRRIMLAKPNKTLMALALRICELYLEEQVRPDVEYHDRLRLELTGERTGDREWLVGVNFFGSQADKRWWQDHRIPAGITFSMNSVGHLIRSSHQVNALARMAGATFRAQGIKSIESSSISLQFAMLTISNAAETRWGRATHLKPLEGQELVAAQPPCPFDQATAMRGVREKDWRTYAAWYHTDHSVPSVYFRAGLERPSKAPPLDLDFTYLFDAGVHNLPHYRIGHGVDVR